MKRNNFFYWILLLVMAFSLSNCNKQKDAFVTPEQLVFEYEKSTQSVTVTYNENYNEYGAIVDEDGQGWCTAAIIGEGKIDITVKTNSTSETRTCYVNCWVVNNEDPTAEKKILPVQVKQNPFRVEVTEATFVRFNFETEAHRYHTDYDGGFDTYQMLYIWHRDWDEMNVTHSNDTLTFWARDIYEQSPNGDLYYDKDFQVSIMITGFAEPYDHCEVNTATFRETWDGRNPDPEAFWQTSTGEDKVILAHIPLKDYNISINGKTGRLYFYYEDDALNVIEAYSRSRSEALNNAECYTENYVYEGSDRDEGLVEVKFNLK